MIAASTPVDCSRAATDSRPSASTWKVTWMRAAPATIGGMPRNSKRASERQSATFSRSPCTTCSAIAVWPSLKVVNSCAREIGMVALRGTIFSVSPPIVSSPSDSGMTSSSNQSSPGARLPASTLAWIAAPSATTWSGLRLLSGGAPKKSATAFWICGMRVAPPTMTTPLISAAVSFASRSTRFTGASVLLTSVSVMAVKVCSVSVVDSDSPEASVASMRATACMVSVSLASRALSINSRVSPADTGPMPVVSRTQQ